MAAVSEIITLGIGTPSGIPPFLTVGLSLSSSLVTVPNVVGNSQAVGTATLQGAGFVVAVQTAYDGVVAAGNIISQSPTAGSSAASGSTVTIVVSIGSAPTFGTDIRNGRRRGRFMSLWGLG